MNWCSGGDSNPHAVKHRLLRPACLPVPPPERAREGQDNGQHICWQAPIFSPAHNRHNRTRRCTKPGVRKQAAAHARPGRRSKVSRVHSAAARVDSDSRAPNSDPAHVHPSRTRTDSAPPRVHSGRRRADSALSRAHSAWHGIDSKPPRVHAKRIRAVADASRHRSNSARVHRPGPWRRGSVRSRRCRPEIRRVSRATPLFSSQVAPHRRLACADAPISLPAFPARRGRQTPALLSASTTGAPPNQDYVPCMPSN